MKLRHIPRILLAILFLLQTACNDENNDSVSPVKETFVSKTSPYLICANRNPGGVGFDFEYAQEEGGANFIDSVSVSDFDPDVTVKTAKGEKPDGTLAGMPYIKLADGAKAVNYSGVDSLATGMDAFTNLSTANMKAVTYLSDDASFTLSALTPGTTGKPLKADVEAEYEKLVIGEKWKMSANNNVEGDELIWIIQTKEGRLVKFIVTDFPADPAPTATGYIAIEWAFLN